MSSKNKLALAVGTVVALISSSAFAGEMAAATNANDVYAWAAAAAGFAIGVAALGGTMGQGRSVAAALEGIARNPGATSKIQTAMILGLAMIESLVLFALVIAFMLQQKVGMPIGH